MIARKKLLMSGRVRYRKQNFDSLPVLYDNSDSPGHIASASSNAMVGPWWPFNQALTQTYDAGFRSPVTGWIQRQTPTAIRLWRFGIRARTGAVIQSPKGFNFEGSMDGVTFTTLVTVAGQVDWGERELRYYEIPEANRRAYPIHRLSILGSNDPTYCTFDELIFNQEIRL